MLTSSFRAIEPADSSGTTERIVEQVLPERPIRAFIARQLIPRHNLSSDTDVLERTKKFVNFVEFISEPH